MRQYVLDETKVLWARNVVILWSKMGLEGWLAGGVRKSGADVVQP